MNVNSVLLQTENTQKLEIAEETEVLRISKKKKRFFRKLTTYFENCTRLQAKPRNASFSDVEHKTTPYRASSVHFATGNFYPFRTLLVWVQKFTIWITRSPREKILPENVSKLTN